MTRDTAAGTVAGPKPATAARRALAARAALAALGHEALRLLDVLGSVRFLTVAQALALGDAPDARRSLGALRRAGLAQVLPFRPNALASVVAVWSLTPLGARAAAARASHAAGEGGLADPALGRRARRLAPGALSPLFLSHALLTTDMYVALRAHADAFAWRSGEDARLSFRSFAAAGGRGVLVPDAVVAPAALPYDEDALALGGSALEIDRATMGKAAIERKLLRYRERIADRGRFGPVLFVAQAPARRLQLERWLQAARLEGAALDREAAAQAAAAVLARLAAEG
jgi:hypothetical protein